MPSHPKAQPDRRCVVDVVANVARMKTLRLEERERNVIILPQTCLFSSAVHRPSAASIAVGVEPRPTRTREGSAGKRRRREEGRPKKESLRIIRRTHSREYGRHRESDRELFGENLAAADFIPWTWSVGTVEISSRLCFKRDCITINMDLVDQKSTVDQSVSVF